MPGGIRKKIYRAGGGKAKTVRIRNRRTMMPASSAPLKEHTLMTSKILIAAPLFAAAALLAGSVVAAPASAPATKAPAAQSASAKPVKAHKHHKKAEKTANKPA